MKSNSQKDMQLPDGWRKIFLSKVAAIIPSNVDKKIYPNEISVLLCNYMDVYANDYLTSKIQYTSGSVSSLEFQKFKLIKGDVIITKDSETPDDIAVPAVVIDEMENVVCGYHLALIRPNNEIDGAYLSKALQTHQCRRHFGNAANGATRYGLTHKVISFCPILLPPKLEQSKIFEILSTIDQAIEKTEQLIAKYERIKTGLMQDLLTRGIDENENIRSEETHEFKDSPLGRIPVEWDVKALEKLVEPNSPIVYGILMPGYGYDNGIPVIKVKDINADEIDLENLLLTSPEIASAYERSKLKEGDLLFTIRGTVGRCAFVPKSLNNANITQDTARLRIANVNSKFVRHYFDMAKSKSYIELNTIGLAVKGINLGELRKLLIAVPPKNESDRIVVKIDIQQDFIKNERKELFKLKNLKNALMQDLLTGKVRVDTLMHM